MDSVKHHIAHQVFLAIKLGNFIDGRMDVRETVIHPISTLETRLKVRQSNGAWRYFVVKLSEQL